MNIYFQLIYFGIRQNIYKALWPYHEFGDEKMVKLQVNTNVQNNQQMLKKKPVPKYCLHSTAGQSSKCQFCQPSNDQNSLPLMVGRSLTKKYSKLVSDSTASSEFNQFVTGLSLSFPGGISQYMIEYTCQTENINLYYGITWIKKQITGLIKRNAQVFKPKLMHFHGSTYYILRRQYRKWRFSPTRILNPGQKYQKIIDLVNNSFVQQGIDNKTAKKEKNKQKGRIMSQTQLQIQSLCKKIGTMCKKVQRGKGIVSKNKSKGKDKAQIIAFEKRSQKKKSSESKKYLEWKQVIENDISVIGKRQPLTPKSIKKSSTNQNQVQQIYGIKNRKQKSKQSTDNFRQYSSKRAATQQAQAIKDSPVTQAYYAKQTNYTEAGGRIKSMHKSKMKSCGSLSQRKWNKKIILTSSSKLISSKSSKKLKCVWKDKVADR